jgi:hypothetical protein
MLHVELINMYINIRANKGSEKLLKNTAKSGKLNKAVYVLYVYVYVYILHTT